MTVYVTPVLNGQTLPEVSGYTETPGMRGAVTTLANGAARRDRVQANLKRRFILIWGSLTTAEKATLVTQFDAALAGAVSFTSPAGDLYTVTVDAGQQELQFESWIGAGQMLYWRTQLLLQED